MADRTENIKKSIEENRDIDMLLLKQRIARCPNCKTRLRRIDSLYVCTKCDYTEVPDRIKIKQAIEENGHLSFTELQAITGIPRDVLSAYLADGLLSIANDSAVKCRICGAPMKNGVTCTKCSSLYSNELKGSTVRVGDTKATQIEYKLSDKNKGKMHFVNRKNS